MVPSYDINLLYFLNYNCFISNIIILRILTKNIDNFMLFVIL
jgi:hypothetical protein